MSERGGPWRLVASLLFLVLAPGTVGGLLPYCRFGTSYKAYRGNVRRWWPGIKPWAA